MELREKIVVVLFCCLSVGMVGIFTHSWYKHRKVMDVEKPIPVGCFKVNGFDVERSRYSKSYYAEILYNGKVYRVHIDKLYCYDDSIKSLKLYYDAEDDSMFESHKAVSEIYGVPITIAVTLVLIFYYKMKSKNLDRVESKGQRRRRRRKERMNHR